MKIASITISYKDKSVLQKHLEALLIQSNEIDEIIVVDNASQDGTCEMIREIFGTRVTLLPLPSNLGTAGGFKVGLQYAYKKNYDWIWLFDQDSVPLPSALYELLKSRDDFQSNDPIGIIASVAICKRSGIAIEGEIWEFRPKKIPSGWRNQPFYFVDTVISSGSLLHRSVIKAVGYPNEDLFIDFVDHEYCLRIRREGFQIAVIRKSVIKHVIGNPKAVSRLGFKRDRMGHPAWREYYRLRNEVYLIWHQKGLKPKLISIGIALRRVAGVLIYEDQRILKLKFILLGFFHGVRGTLGKRVLPQT